MANKTTKAPPSATLLVELLTEELPPKVLKQLGREFALKTLDGLASFGFINSVVDFTYFVTPRRLAVQVPNVREKAPDTERDVMGPSVGAPTQSAEGFARKHGVTVVELKKKQTPKGEVYVVHVTTTGQTLADALASKVESALQTLPIPKLMRWGGGDAQFVRPVHGLVMLHGSRIVPGAVLGVASSNKTLGHRFLSGGAITLKHADDYERTLRERGKVVVDFTARRAEIVKQLEKTAGSAQLVAGDALLDEITALVEAPAVYAGEFDSSFLTVPEECLILSMQQHQKYVPLRDKATGKLLPRFLFVSNVETKQPHEIIHGNERVLRARLADAKFFFEQDGKISLSARLPALKRVIYQNKLGTQFERAERIKNLSINIGRLLKFTDQELNTLERAALWCKCDLMTEMVGEFPELQGVMGKYYLLATDKGWDVPQVAQAIEEHYRPKFAGDQLPESKIGICVALADKLDVLVGIFGVGLLPTGEKDPYALRRHALGVLRILCERKLPLDLDQVLKMAHNDFPPGRLIASHEHGGISVPNSIEVRFFVIERAKSYLRDLGYSTLEVESVLDLNPRPSQFVGRLNAVREFLTLPEATGLAEADKRIRNILTKSGGVSIVQLADESLLQVDAEKQLLRTTRLLRQQVNALVEVEKFSDALLLTAQIHQPVSRFFDQVMVNVEDLSIRNNRFALLHEVDGLTNQVANISKLAA